MFTRKLDVKNPLRFDSLCPGNHGNITTVRNLSATLTYITKDGNYRLLGWSKADIDLLIQGQSTTLVEIACAIRKNQNMQDIAMQFPAQYIQRSRGMHALAQVYKYAAATKVTPFELSSKAPPAHHGLHLWFRTNFLEQGRNPLRSHQLFLHGPSATGKTRFLAFLARHYRAFIIPADEKYMDNYDDTAYDYLVHDELGSGHKVNWWKSLLGGEPMVLPVKGSQVVKRRNLPIVLASNSNLREIYRNVATFHPLSFEALTNRLLCIDVENNPLHSYVDWLELQEEVSDSDSE